MEGVGKRIASWCLTHFGSGGRVQDIRKKLFSPKWRSFIAKFSFSKSNRTFKVIPVPVLQP